MNTPTQEPAPRRPADFDMVTLPPGSTIVHFPMPAGEPVLLVIPPGGIPSDAAPYLGLALQEYTRLFPILTPVGGSDEEKEHPYEDLPHVEADDEAEDSGTGALRSQAIACVRELLTSARDERLRFEVAKAILVSTGRLPLPKVDQDQEEIHG